MGDSAGVASQTPTACGTERFASTAGSHASTSRTYLPSVSVASKVLLTPSCISAWAISVLRMGVTPTPRLYVSSNARTSLLNSSGVSTCSQSPDSVTTQRHDTRQATRHQTQREEGKKCGKEAASKAAHPNVCSAWRAEVRIAVAEQALRAAYWQRVRLQHSAHLPVG